MFPDNAPANEWLPISPGKNGSQGFNMTTGGSSYVDWVIKLSTKNCPKYSAAFNDVANSTAFKEARGYFYENYKDQLSHLVNWDNISWQSFDDICEYLFFS
jgi:hypothetical protein